MESFLCVHGFCLVKIRALNLIVSQTKGSRFVEISRSKLPKSKHTLVDLTFGVNKHKHEKGKKKFKCKNISNVKKKQQEVKRAP